MLLIDPEQRADRSGISAPAGDQRGDCLAHDGAPLGDRTSPRLSSSHSCAYRMPSSPEFFTMLPTPTRHNTPPSSPELTGSVRPIPAGLERMGLRWAVGIPRHQKLSGEGAARFSKSGHVADRSGAASR